MRRIVPMLAIVFVAGAAVAVTPHFGLRLDANVSLQSSGVFYDPVFRPSFGVNWRF